MTDSAPGSTSTTAGSAARPGSTPSGSPSPPTGTGVRASAAQLDPRAGQHGDLGQRHVRAVVHLRQRADQRQPGRGLDHDHVEQAVVEAASGAISMPLP